MDELTAPVKVFTKELNEHQKAIIAKLEAQSAERLAKIAEAEVKASQKKPMPRKPMLLRAFQFFANTAVRHRNPDFFNNALTYPEIIEMFKEKKLFAQRACTVWREIFLFNSLEHQADYLNWLREEGTKADRRRADRIEKASAIGTEGLRQVKKEMLASLDFTTSPARGFVITAKPTILNKVVVQRGFWGTAITS